MKTLLQELKTVNENIGRLRSIAINEGRPWSTFIGVASDYIIASLVSERRSVNAKKLRIQRRCHAKIQ
jgi:hypothetical protein